MQPTTIYKYPLDITDRQTIRMPGPVGVIHAGLDPHGTPCVWAIVRPDNPLQDVTVAIVGTGHPLMADVLGRFSHVGSFVHLGTLVWHVFVPAFQVHR